MSRADQLLLNKLLLKDDAKVQRARARSQARIARKKIRREWKKERKKGKEKKTQREERKREKEGENAWLSRRITSLSSKSVHPNRARVSAGPNWRDSRGLLPRFKTLNGRALPQQMVVVIAAASDEHLPSSLDGYRNTDARFLRCHALTVPSFISLSRFIFIDSALSPFI